MRETILYIFINLSSIGSKDGKEPPSLRDRLPSELSEDPLAIADLAYRDISAISMQIVDIWYRLVTTAPLSAKEYCCLMKTDYERKLVDRYSANLVRETKVGNDLSDPQEDDGEFKERFGVAKQLRDSLRIDGGYQGIGLANLAVEPTVSTSSIQMRTRRICGGKIKFLSCFFGFFDSLFAVY